MPARHGEHQQPTGDEHPVRLGEQRGLVGHVLQHVEQTDRVEAAVGERQRPTDPQPVQRQVGVAGGQPGEVTGVRVGALAGHGAVFVQRGEEVPGAAAQVEVSAGAAGQRGPGERVPAQRVGGEGLPARSAGRLVGPVRRTGRALVGPAHRTSRAQSASNVAANRAPSTAPGSGRSASNRRCRSGCAATTAGRSAASHTAITRPERSSSRR